MQQLVFSIGSRLIFPSYFRASVNWVLCIATMFLLKPLNQSSKSVLQSHLNSFKLHEKKKIEFVSFCCLKLLDLTL